MVRAIQAGLGRWGFSWSKEVIPNVPAVEMVGYVDTAVPAQELLKPSPAGTLQVRLANI